jgi:glycyl-tRNA synthetase
MDSSAKVEKLKEFSALVSLCKRRGFIFQSSEIYGGLNSCWDYGPLGVELKNNVKQVWWKAMTSRPDVVGLDSSILMAPKIWEASGHVSGFSDPLVECKKCHSRFREDQIKENQCSKCDGELMEARQFNLMFKTFMGPVEDSASVVFMRPETAQGIYVNFENVQVSMRKKVPFGIAQIGKAFRNEITPGHFTFRTREFEQMEMQFFVKPGTDDNFMNQWKEIRSEFYSLYGISKEKIRFHQHTKDELAHYAKDAYDIEYEFPGIGWQEIEGIHNRTDFDLKRHQEFSGKNLQYFDEANKEKYIPFVVETSAGCDRSVLAILCDAYREELTLDSKGKADKRVVMGFHPILAPVKVAILPLSKKENLMNLAMQIRSDLSQSLVVQSDETGSIGKRYRRQDEIGTPFCVTIDFDSLEDEKVTIRHRDSMVQDRVEIKDLKKTITHKLETF